MTGNDEHTNYLWYTFGGWFIDIVIPTSKWEPLETALLRSHPILWHSQRISQLCWIFFFRIDQTNFRKAWVFQISFQFFHISPSPLFHSYVSHYQRLNPIKTHQTIIFPWFSYDFPTFPRVFPCFFMVFLWFSHFSQGFPMVFPMAKHGSPSVPMTARRLKAERCLGFWSCHTARPRAPRCARRQIDRKRSCRFSGTLSSALTCWRDIYLYIYI